LKVKSPMPADERVVPPDASKVPPPDTDKGGRNALASKIVPPPRVVLIVPLFAREGVVPVMFFETVTTEEPSTEIAVDPTKFKAPVTVGWVDAKDNIPPFALNTIVELAPEVE